MRVLLVQEMTRGNGVHNVNVERAAAGRRGMTVDRVRIGYRERPTDRWSLPPVNWSVEASLRARAGVRRARREGPVDAMFVHTQSCALLLGPQLKDVPTVISLDATPIGFDAIGSQYGHPVRGRRVEDVKRGVVGAALRSAAMVTTWSQWAAGSVVRDYRVPTERVRVIRPGVQLDRFRPTGPRPDDGPVRLLFVGGDFERKGGVELLTAFSRLGGDVELDIVTSSVPPGLPAGARAHVDVGHDSEHLSQLYRSADVFVVPSQADAYGLVYAEAMAAGLPIVACDVGAVGEMVIDGLTGRLVPVDDADALTHALRRLVDDAELRRRLGAGALRLATEEHDATRTCGDIVDLLESLTTRRSPRDAVAGPGRQSPPEFRPGRAGRSLS